MDVKRPSSPLEVVPAPLPMFDVWPRLAVRLPTVALGDGLPSPVEPMASLGAAIEATGASLWIKRDDRSSSVYGGNKVRTLEVLFGDALARGASVIVATGAFGSNHATATALHAPRVGLRPGALLFPQPVSRAARENLEATLSACEPALVTALPHWSALPLAMVHTAARHRRQGRRAVVMEPGGATPLGALGYVSAAFELARQIEADEVPRPHTIVLGVGSTCTTAGLLVGMRLAARLGLGFCERDGRMAVPRLVAVRVTPWPVTAATRIAGLAVRTSRLLARLVGDASLEIGHREAMGGLRVDGRFLGPGYGRATRRGEAAARLFAAHGGPGLDTTYTQKAGAGLLWWARRSPGPVLYWSTKSTVALPAVDGSRISLAPGSMRRWLARDARH